MKSEVKTTTTQNIFRIILASFMLIAGYSHLSFFREDFQAQVPDWVPMSKDLVVLLSGVVEIILGLALLFWKANRVYIGWFLGLFFILVFPGNVAQYLDHKDAFGSLDTDQARLMRLFFQPVLIAWAIWSTGAWTAYRESKK